MTTPASEKRRQAKELEAEANVLDRAELSGHEKFIVVEQIQDGRPRASGPYTWDDAVIVAGAYNRVICDFLPPLP